VTGTVRRSIKTPFVSLKNGMGVELLKKDRLYVDFIKSVFPDSDDMAGREETKPKTECRGSGEGRHAHNTAGDEFIIMACPRCGVKNKVSRNRLSHGPRCGKCGSTL
jgi:hypothetical protein